MQVYSMTGYASVQSQSVAGALSAHTGAEPAGRLGMEIRSVNSRFLDLSLRLPDELRASEPALRELLTAKLKRGKVEVRAAIEMEKSVGVAAPSTALLDKLRHTQAQVLATLPQAVQLSVADVLRLAGNESQGTQDWSGEVISLARQALDSLTGARAREGERLAHMLLDHISQLRGLAVQA